MSSESSYWEKSFMLGLSKLIILSILRSGPLHGYGIIKAIESRSNECCSITPGSVYPVLKELKNKGLISDTNVKVQGRARVNYELTNEGRAVLKEGLEMWEVFVAGTKGIFYDTANLEQQVE